MADWDQENQALNGNAIWLNNVKMKLGEVSLVTSEWSICKVPSKIRNVYSDAYSPQIISIGPVHYGKKNLQSMETHKKRYAAALFGRTQDPIGAFDACGNAIFGLINDIRACYKEPLTKSWGKEKLAEIFLLDGCFILELFLRYFSNHHDFQSDPVFSTFWVIPSLQHDLALLENQIPLIILDVLYFNLAMTCSPLNELALRFFRLAMGVDDETIAVASGQRGNHLLHLLHNFYAPTFPKTIRTQEELDPMKCATTLAESGIKFRVEKDKSILNLRFDNGVFIFPRLIIHDFTDSLLRNLVAFEQCCPCDAQYVSSYVLLMDRLVDTAADVELLEREHIIKNNLGGCDDVSKFLNNISKQIVVQEFYFAGLCEKVNHCYNTNRQNNNKRRHRYCAALKRDYFKNPWTIISLIAGFVLLVLTLLQTFYSVRSYYPH